MTVMLAAAVLILAFVLAILAGLSALAGRELLHLRARIVELEREAGDKAGEVKGLTVAIDQASLGQQLSTWKALATDLQADLKELRTHQRATLERAQDAAGKVLTIPPYGYPRNGG